MKSFPPELVYVLIFVFIMLFQFVMKKLGQNAQQEQQDPQELMPDENLSEYPEEVTEIAAVPSRPKPTVGTFGRTAAPKAVPQLGRPRFCRRSLMGTRREVQNAVVIASILGPCRAFEPHDKR